MNRPPVVITAAIVGAEVFREQTPHVPYTPEEIAAEAVRCREQGAAIVHLHMREPDGQPSQRAELFREAIEKIRAQCDVIVQVSTGGAVGMEVDERTQPLTLTGPVKPDMATLSTGTLNFGDDVFWNPMPLVRDIARRIQAAGVKPEIEAFDAGMIDTARRLAKEGLLELPAHFDFVTGVPGGIAFDRQVVEFMRSRIPEGSTWTCAAVGRFQLPMIPVALELGGNVRVGLEDNIFIAKGVLAKGSSELVQAAAAVAREQGVEIATPDRARELLRVPKVV